MPERAVVDASAMVDLLAGTPLAEAVQVRLRGHELHAPAHFDAEVLSALGRLHGGGEVTARRVGDRLRRVADAPIQRHELAPLLAGAWRRRGNVRLVDALYVELASRLDVVIVTTDAGLASAAPRADLVTRAAE